MSKYNYNKDYFSIIDSPDKAYWLGFLYADGCITRFYKGEELRSMSLEMTLCEQDKSHLEKFIKSLDSNVPIKEKKVILKEKTYICYRLVINCTKLCYDLINLGCVPAKTYIINFPDENKVPHKYMSDFLRGFFDGDGCISIRNSIPNKRIETNITGMKHMLESIINYLYKEKILNKAPKIFLKKNSNAYMTYIYGYENNKKFLDYLYNDSKIYLDRKYQKYIEFYK